MIPGASTQTVYNDGQVQYGSIIVVLKYSGSPGSTAAANFASSRGTFILEDFTVTRPTKLNRQRDEIGGPRAQWLVKDFTDATGVLQLNDASVSGPNNPGNPQVGDVFTTTLEQEIGPELFMIHSIGAAYKQEDYWKRNISLCKIINPNTAPNFTPL